MASAIPRITVLCQTLEDIPPFMSELSGIAQLDYCDNDSLERALVGAEGLFLWDFFSSSLEQAWPAADNLRWVHVAAAGVDRLLFPALVESSVSVTNARGIFDRPIAEYVLAAMLAVAKDFRTTYALQATRTWQHRELDDLRASKALIVGTGGIGREIARLLRAMGVDVRGVGRSSREVDPDLGEIVASAHLIQHVGWADTVIAVAPLTDSTAGMFERSIFSAMKHSAHFINVGRGGLVVEHDLVEALEKRELAHATLDVFAQEPLSEDSRLWGLEGVTITAHMSGDTRGWRDRLALQFVRNARAWAAGGDLENLVDKGSGFAGRTIPEPRSIRRGS